MSQSQETRRLEHDVEQTSVPSEVAVIPIPTSAEKEEEEDDEEEEEDKIVEKSYNNRFHKRNKRFPTQIDGVDNTFVAIEPKSGKEVIWNERLLPDKKTERDNRFLAVVKKLKKHAHPFLIRFLDAWITKSESGPLKLVFITERLEEGTLKQFLCNSTTRSKLLWRRHIGQLLSVLIFLHHLGVTHGNLRKETIYYQDSGNVKVGPFMLEAFFGQKSPDSDIYALGVLALEIAAWTQSIDTQALSEDDRIQLMLHSLVDPQQRNFIESCCDPNLASRPKIKTLLNNPAVAEVPTLKLLSAKVIVGSMQPITTEDTVVPTAAGTSLGGVSVRTTMDSGGGKQETPTGFVDLLKDYISHLEDETVIVEVTFPTDQVNKALSWKDFRSNPTFTSKYLEDVKNGFYPFLGYRFGGTAIEQEEDDDASTGPLGTIGTSADVVCNGQQQTNVSVAPEVISDVVSSTTSRKHSASVVGVATDQSAESPAQVISIPTEASVAANKTTTAAAEVVNDSYHSTSITDSAPAVLNKEGQAEVDLRRRSLPNSLKYCTSAIHQLKKYVQGFALAEAGGLNIAAEASTLLNPMTVVQIPPSLRRQQTATDARQKRIRLRSACAYGNIDLSSSCVASNGVEHVTGHSNLTALSPRRCGQGFPSRKAPHTPRASVVSSVVHGLGFTLDTLNGVKESSEANNQQHLEVGMEDDDVDELSDDDDDDDDVNDSEEDEDDGTTSKGGSKGTEKGVNGGPQVVHVSAPTQAPTTPALFTHCQYSYIGMGRWQVYVQMWFVEERLKREAYLQVLDSEWHDYDRVADLFEMSKCLSSNDKSTFSRLLAMARHNIPLVEGELVFPFVSTPCNGKLNTQELCSKLLTLHLHQQTMELLNHDEVMNSMQGQTQSSAFPDDVSPRQQKSHYGVCPSSEINSAFKPQADTSDSVMSFADAVHVNAVNASNPLDTCGATIPTSGIMTGVSDVPCPSDGNPCPSSVPLSQNGPGSCPHELIAKDGTADVPGCGIGEHQTPSNISAAPIPNVMVASSTSAQTSSSNPSMPQHSSPVNGQEASVEMLDVGALAPRDSACAFCDRHDYLHRLDLPGYLTSPCYHCRESLAREAKVTPEDLFDLHLLHNVPWPAFLQFHFNIPPPDGRTLEEMIAYDCRWRGREPCTCLSDASPMPPCVEFPWLYELSSTGGPEHESPLVVPPQLASPLSPPPAAAVATVPTNSTAMTTSDTKQGDASVAPQPQPKGSQTVASLVALLPCAGRHSRGSLGPPQCCGPVECPANVPKVQCVHQKTETQSLKDE